MQNNIDVKKLSETVKKSQQIQANSASSDNIKSSETSSNVQNSDMNMNMDMNIDMGTLMKTINQLNSQQR